MQSLKLVSFAAFVLAANAVKLRTKTSGMNKSEDWHLDTSNPACLGNYVESDEVVTVPASEWNEEYTYKKWHYCYQVDDV
jgi:hypothetical protein